MESNGHKVFIMALLHYSRGRLRPGYMHGNDTCVLKYMKMYKFTNFLTLARKHYS